MKTIFTFLFLIYLGSSIFAQTPVQVITGADYANEVYYNFENDTLKSSPRNSWDIAFATNQMSASILANNGAGVMLYSYPGGTIDDWSTVDTTGVEMTPLYNSIEDWELGAFNDATDTSNIFDYGWGVYNMSTHNVDGDSIFIIKLTNGDFKKLAIIQKNSIQNQWTFQYADLNGENDTTVTVDVDDYAESEFLYYSVVNDSVVGQEPDERWQLLFTRYYDYNIPYYVTGVLANKGVQVQQVNGVSQEAFVDYNTSLSNDTLSSIGSDWKTFNMSTFQYEVASDVVYFVQDTVGPDDAIWKLYFTGFGGSSTGIYSFVKMKMEVTGIKTISERNLAIYPNPASSEINVIHDFSGDTEITIYNISGQPVFKTTSMQNSGLNKQVVNVSSLPSGIYSLMLRSGNDVKSVKFLKE